MITELLSSLLVWTSVQMGVPPDITGLDIQPVTQAQQIQLGIGLDVAAVFMLDGEHVGKIFLTDNVNLDTNKGKSFVVHEMVHFIQYKSGYFVNNKCAASSEPLAYRIQNKFLTDRGEEPHATELFAKFVSVCWRVTDK